MKNLVNIFIVAAVFVVVFGALLAMAFGLSYAESAVAVRSFNRITGKNISTWDYMWTGRHLRLIEEEK